MNDVMVDLETLGRRAGCAILSIGAVEFDASGLGREFYCVVSRKSQKEFRILHEDPETVKWWSERDPAAQKVILQASHRTATPLQEALTGFKKFLEPSGRQVKIWGNGSDFDNAILICLYETCEMTVPWSFWNNRCYRTLKNLHPEIKMERVGTYHNALDDAKSQALHAVRMLYGQSEAPAGIGDGE